MHVKIVVQEDVAAAAALLWATAEHFMEQPEEDYLKMRVNQKNQVKEQAKE